MRDIIILLAVLTVLAALLAWALRLLTRTPLNPRIRNLLIGLGMFEVALLLLHTTTWNTQEVTSYWDWLFDLDRELNVGTAFSSLQFIFLSRVSLVLGWNARAANRKLSLYWLLLGIAFAFLAVDEYFIIHEQLFEMLDLPGEWWRYLYAAGGAALVILSLYVFRRWLWAEKRTFALFFTGLIIMGLSGIALERLIWNVTCPGVPGCYERMLVIEEILELVGQTIMLAGLLIHAHKQLSPPWWRSFNRLRIVVIGIWLLGLLFYLRGWPALEMRLLAQQVSVRYANDALQLVGYRLSSEVVQPGDSLDVTLFFRPNERLPENYNFSVRLFSKPDAVQVAQQDLEALDVRHIPSRGWRSGSLNRVGVSLAIPDDLPAPASYWVGVRLWYGDWQDTRGLDIATTPHQLLTPDVVVLTSVAAPGQSDNAPSAVETHYIFAEGFTLTSYTLPDSAAPGAAFTPMFAWRTEHAIDRALTQFVHFINADGEFVFGHDQPPFAGRFPTEDWPAGMQAQDSWLFAIPDDAPPGEYRVFTGLYDADIQRVPVTDAAGQPAPDHAILLGTVRIGA